MWSDSVSLVVASCMTPRGRYNASPAHVELGGTRRVGGFGRIEVLPTERLAKSANRAFAAAILSPMTRHGDDETTTSACVSAAPRSSPRSADQSQVARRQTLKCSAFRAWVGEWAARNYKPEKRVIGPAGAGAILARSPLLRVDRSGAPQWRGLCARIVARWSRGGRSGGRSGACRSELPTGHATWCNNAVAASIVG